MTVPNQRPLQTHRNHYLFADYYLDNRLIDQPDWSTVDVSPTLAELTRLWASFTPHGDNESQTEEEWIRPVLRVLGHSFNVQVPLKTPFGVRKPDYLLYPDEASRQTAKAHTGPFDSQILASTALAVADAKAWERNLDQTGSRQGAVISGNPSLQMYVYVQHSYYCGILTAFKGLRANTPPQAGECPPIRNPRWKKLAEKGEVIGLTSMVKELVAKSKVPEI